LTSDATSEAPGRLELVRQFVNTSDLEEGWDKLATPEGIREWLAEQDLPAAERLDAAETARFTDAREGLRALLLANNGAPLDEGAVARLDAVAQGPALRVRFSARAEPEGGPGGQPRAALEPVDTGPDAALAAILAAAYASMEEGTWQRLKACRADTCRWAFYDRSRNRSGKWCSMEVCGNRSKARTYRHRHGERQPRPAP
jgi:predicted RNA-binding Zn ribbon-like protein